MTEYLLVYRSLTYTQKAARLLARAGISSSIQKSPGALSEDGCTYSVKISEKKLAHALEILTGAGAPPSRILSLRGGKVRMFV